MSELDTTGTREADVPRPSPPPDVPEPVGEPREAPEADGDQAPDEDGVDDHADPEGPEQPEVSDDPSEDDPSETADASGEAADDPADPADPAEPEEPEEFEERETSDGIDDAGAGEDVEPTESDDPEGPVEPEPESVDNVADAGADADPDDAGEDLEPAEPEASDESAEPDSVDDAVDAVDAVDARAQAARADGLIDDAGRVPVEELESGDRVRGRPCDDTGYEIRDEDLEYLGLDEQQVEAWQRFEAPLGMAPEQFKEFKSSLNDALAADGIDPERVDIRLQGSSAQFFSGSHKDFPTERDLADQPEAQTRLADWMGDRPESERPARIPFDAKHLLKVEDAEGVAEPPSDYDVQISSDSMVDKATETWEAADPAERKPDVMHPKYGFVDKRVAERAFPALDEWTKHWEQETGREVAPALFSSEGPPDTSGVGTGISTHFRDTDWIINRPGGDARE
ncbi:hypothetical protein [Streptomyces sp. NPDC002602]|uniref:hypothetical protein n=1 Tax=Streptomyces sp. NPDC002602 TaxID=3364654 RepID=UPI0036C432D5